MKIQYKKGCLIQGFKKHEVQAIAHQANCQNTMGSGVAKAIREAYPEVYEADCETIKGAVDKLGTLSMVIVPRDRRKSFSKCIDMDAYCGPIFNLYGQFNYGRDSEVVYTDIGALRSALQQMKLFLDAMDITRVGLPKLGCGLGGEKWENVSLVIEEVLCDNGIQVIVYEKE
ncbi:phosphatase [Pseudomonas phage vB_PpuM-NoPa]|uniref:Phosphatase n=1 Tax=Pseudomonas phage vB_PpuM-NoPa TaxID=3132619 RepID=A0AAX4MYJ1_9CAUD